MIAMILSIWCWTLDRVEPPFAVLISPQGVELDVALSRLPAGVAPGDLLATPLGPVVGSRARTLRTVAERLRQMAAEPGLDFSL